jgi:hypothetical protein
MGRWCGIWALKSPSHGQRVRLFKSISAMHTVPIPLLGEHAAVLAIDGGKHPVARHVFVSAADEIDLVLARAGARLLGIAAPHRPRDDFRAAIAQLARDFGKESVVANHHADLAQTRVEDRIIAALATCLCRIRHPADRLSDICPATLPSGPMSTATLNN